MRFSVPLLLAVLTLPGPATGTPEPLIPDPSPTPSLYTAFSSDFIPGDDSGSGGSFWPGPASVSQVKGVPRG